MPADHHIVGNLHQIIDLRALADHRIAQGTAIDGAVGTDLHFILKNDTADLRYLQVATRARLVPEPVLPQTGARMDDDPVSTRV